MFGTIYIQLAQATQDEAEDEAEDDRTDLDSSADDQSHTRPTSGLTISSTTDRGSTMQSPDLKRSSATIASATIATAETKSGNSMTAPTTGKRRRVVMQSSLLLKFLNPDFPMFHNREPLWVKSEFGVLNDDLFFNDSTVAELASKNQ